MKPALLDTNFILSCVSQKIDFFDELFQMGYKILIPSNVLKEIDGLSISRGRGLKVKNASALASDLININKNNFETINLGNGKVDNLIVKYARENPDIAIATLDKELRNKIKLNSKITIADKRRLEVGSK